MVTTLVTSSGPSGIALSLLLLTIAAQQVHAFDSSEIRMLDDEYGKRSVPLIRFGKRSSTDKREEFGGPLIRFGKRSAPVEDAVAVDADDEGLPIYRYARAQTEPLIRFGKRSSSAPLIRFGRSPNSAPLIRFGKRSSAAPFVRFGRTATVPLIRFGKRAVSEQSADQE